MSPKISVLMPVFNGAQYLRSAIDSVRSQTFENWELLCIDDGSSDCSREIVKSISHLDARVQLVALEHQGIVPALNEGVRRSHAEFIARLDSDDLASPDRFAQQLDWLAIHPNLAMIGGGYETIDVDNNVWKVQQPSSSPSETKQALLQNNCMAHSAVMVRRSVLAKFSGPYRSHFPLAEDYDLWLRISEEHELGNCPSVVLKYRRDLQNVSPARIIQQTLSTLAVQHSHQCRLRGESDPAERWHEVDFATLVSLGISPNVVKAAIRRILLSEARLTAKHGFSAKSQELLKVAHQYWPADEGVLSMLDYLWRRTKTRFTSVSKNLPPRERCEKVA